MKLTWKIDPENYQYFQMLRQLSRCAGIIQPLSRSILCTHVISSPSDVYGHGRSFFPHLPDSVILLGKGMMQTFSMN